jgi:RND family efflux transporter MFP subunit
MGIVQAAREVELCSLVDGEIVSVSPDFVPGGRFRKGEVLLQIDSTDYDLAVRQRESEVTRARSALALEMGQQAIARREYELLEEDIADQDRELVLRRPQLAAAEATLASAEAALAQARLSKRRTAVSAPFNAAVKERKVNLGAQVSVGSPLATVVGSDEYWVAAAVPVNQLKWISIPRSSSERGSAARVYCDAAWGEGVWRLGSVVRLASELEEQGRMARVFVSVRDPLALERANAGNPAMIVGTYARVEIEGIELDSVAVIGRTMVRDGDRLWIMNDEDKLEIRPVDIVFRGTDEIFVGGGVREGERLVTTDLSAPVQGMALRAREKTQSGEAPDRGAETGSAGRRGNL